MCLCFQMACFKCLFPQFFIIFGDVCICIQFHVFYLVVSAALRICMSMRMKMHRGKRVHAEWTLLIFFIHYYYVHFVHGITSFK